MNKLDTKTRQKQIIDASLHLIKDGGIQNLTIKNLSLSVGISEQAIYRHFRSKQDILCAVINHFNQHFLKVFEEVKSTSGMQAKINVFIDSHLMYFSENPETAAVIFSEEIFQNDSKLAKAVHDLVVFRVQELTRFFEKAQMVGEIKSKMPAEHIALIALGSLRFLVTVWRLDGFKTNLVEDGKSLKRSLMTLFG